MPDAFGLPVSCLRCAGPVHLVNTTAQSGSQSIAVVACRACRVEWVVESVMRLHRTQVTA